MDSNTDSDLVRAPLPLASRFSFGEDPTPPPSPGKGLPWPPTTDRYVPMLLVRQDGARRPIEDVRARLLLGFIDGRTPIFELLAATKLPLGDAVDALVVLFEAEVVAFRTAALEAAPRHG